MTDRLIPARPIEPGCLCRTINMERTGVLVEVGDCYGVLPYLPELGPVWQITEMPDGFEITVALGSVAGSVDWIPQRNLLRIDDPVIYRQICAERLDERKVVAAMPWTGPGVAS